MNPVFLAHFLIYVSYLHFEHEKINKIIEEK